MQKYSKFLLSFTHILGRLSIKSEIKLITKYETLTIF